EVLDTASVRKAGLPSVVTVHNVPPQECRQVGPDTPLSQSVKEAFRLQLVGWKNRKRLLAHRYDGVIVPSEEVQKLLVPVLGDQVIDVVGHGPTRDLQAKMAPASERKPQPGEPVRLLTAGGYAPHKRQHLIPDVASRLLEKGVNFEWTVAGPSGRVAGYYESVQSKVDRAGLRGRVHLCGAVPFGDLAKLYDSANIYVQPSVEEGFCITALDAAAAGLPVVASPAGALADIAEISHGRLVESNAGALADAIFDLVDTGDWADATATSRNVQSQFSWSNAAQSLTKRYKALAAYDRTDVAQSA
ncbi:MAG: glycosyltransferase family 4 protein, partial [Pseudomonadota bacterium]